MIEATVLLIIGWATWFCLVGKDAELEERIEQLEKEVKRLDRERPRPRLKRLETR